MASPGWYDDPRGGGGQRWWTGLGWSAHVAGPARTTTSIDDAASRPRKAVAATESDDLDGSWSVPGTGEAILRPGYDDPMMRGYVAAEADSYRPWFASIGGLAAAIVALGLGALAFSLVFAAIGAVPLVLLPGRLASRARAVGVARHAAEKEGRRPGARASERLASWREVALAVVVAALLVGYAVLLVRELSL
jgi:hypothetical protein